MYGCSPRWRDDWIAKSDLQKILEQLSGRIEETSLGPNSVGLNHGLHFTGGEPFMNFNLLLESIGMAHDLGIPSIFVETNCFWCTDDETTRDKLKRLKDSGSKGILISANPFVIEQTPFERTQRANRIGREVFGRNVLLYQELFYSQFEKLGFRGALPFQEYLKSHSESLRYAELIPMGRAVHQLGYLFRNYPAKTFGGLSCKEELTRDWHVHVDNYCNYVPGYCGGISLGDARNLHAFCNEGVDLEEHPILHALITNLRALYEFAVKEFNYQERIEGYISKCHLCLDIREHTIKEGGDFGELEPKELYRHL